MIRPSTFAIAAVVVLSAAAASAQAFGSDATLAPVAIDLVNADHVASTVGDLSASALTLH